MRVLRAAEQACRNHNHYYVGTGHVLLALLDEHDIGLEARLRADGIAPQDLRAELVRSLGTGDERSWEGILVTPRVRGVVGSAERRAGDSCDVDPAHLLEALLAEDAGLTAEVVGRIKAAATVGLSSS